MASFSKRALYLGHGRGRGRGNVRDAPPINNWTKMKEEHKEMDKAKPSKERLEKAHKIKESAKKFVNEEYLDDSSEDEEIEDVNVISSTLKSYTDTSQESMGDDTLNRTTQYLMDSCRPGANTCLICIGSIKHVDAIWHCGQCFSIFHINCIQKWATDGAINTSPLSQENFPALQMSWFCPKCRCEYKQSECPSKYYCYCGKEQDPKFDPWIVPHSCGQTCIRHLKPACGHDCLLLCHPGPCPPCPKTIQSKCYCGKNGPDIRRCGSKDWSCGKPCAKPLACGHHNCTLPCHSGECPPCPKESLQSCACGKGTVLRPCASPQWHCQQVCGGGLSCGFHICEKVCHTGTCIECPRTGQRSCPCGKSKFTLPCTEDVPTCGDTCNKELQCGRHNCTQRCHFGPCGPCRQFITKTCRCGKREKNVQCCMEYLCESKCTNMRQCNRHQCKRKCCDNKCPSCEQICGRSLNCKNHKCHSPCHRGLCYPCPLTVDVSCFCGKTIVTLPCGREKTTKPPKCSEPCKHPPDCHHPQRIVHRCHYGNCPPCRQTCGNSYQTCDHSCIAVCHDNDYSNKVQDVTPPQPVPVIHMSCPPCHSLVPRKCFGEHESQSLPCCEANRYSCCRPCDRLQHCGNHTCQLECHYVTGAPSENQAGHECQECEEPCNKLREPGCCHECTRPCHLGECQKCKQMVKTQCHCQLMVVYIQCSEWTSSNKDKRDGLMSCKSHCPKNLACGHRCSEDCHPGSCPNTDTCNKKTYVRCPCKRIKKDYPCSVMQSGEISLQCDQDCEDSKRKREQQDEEAKMKKNEEEHRLQKEEMELFERNRRGKKRRPRKQEEEVIEPWWIVTHKRDVLLSALAIVVVAFLFYLAIR